VENQPNGATRANFGPFEYDDLSGSLRKSGNLMRLQGKPLQILLFLIDRPGQLVGRNELQDHLWKGTTFVDFEQGLNSAVNKLRQTLGDSADQPRYVETFPDEATASLLRFGGTAIRRLWKHHRQQRRCRPTTIRNKACQAALASISCGV
jgi:hypothetical protein